MKVDKAFYVSMVIILAEALSKGKSISTVNVSLNKNETLPLQW